MSTENKIVKSKKASFKRILELHDKMWEAYKTDSTILTERWDTILKNTKWTEDGFDAKITEMKLDRLKNDRAA